MKIWDLDRGKLKYSFNKANGTHQDIPTALLPLENGYLASSAFGEVKIWDIQNGKLKFTLNQTDVLLSRITIFSLATLDNGYLAAGSDSAIKIWNITTGKLRYSFD